MSTNKNSSQKNSGAKEKKDSGIPLGLGMALAQNEAAMGQFEKLSEGQRNVFIASAGMVHSKKEMQQLVQNLSEGKAPEGQSLSM